MASKKNEDRLMTLQDVALYLQIKERTIYGWAQSGKIPAFKLGNTWRFEREDIDRWIEDRKKETQKFQTTKNAEFK